MTEYHLTEFKGKNVCAEEGDSGGPVFAGRTALGLLSAGRASGPPCNNFVLYVEITEADDALGVSVGSRIGKSPSEEAEVEPVIPPGEDDNFPGPHATVQENGTLDVFYRTPSGELGHDWYDTGGSGWHSGNLPGSVASAPHATVQANGTVDVFYRTPAGELGHDWYGSGGGGWASGNLPGSVASDPHPVVQPNGTVDVFYRTPAGELGHDWFDTGGSGWHAGNLPGSVASQPYAVAQANGTVDVFYRTPSGELGHDWYQSNGEGWHSGNLPGSVASDPHPVVQSNGTIDVFYSTPAGELGHDWYDTGGSGWHAGNLPGSVASDPHAVVQPNGTVDVFYRTPAGELGHDWFDTGGSGWHSGNLAGSVASDPTPVVQPNGTIDVFYRTPAGELGHDWFDTGGSGWHSGNLPGELDPSSTPHAVAQANGTVDVFYSTPAGELGHDWFDTGGSGWHSGNLAGSLLNPKAPKATSEAATGVKATEAALHATVNPEGAATTYQFEYGKTTSYGTSVPVPAPALGNGTAGLEEGKALTGLSEGATYHFRVVATNEMGTTYGADKTFTTPKAIEAPTVATKLATDVGAIKATLHAAINPGGAPTTYQFEYGKTISYGSKAPAELTSAGSGSGNVEESQALSSLEPGTTYHFRIVATNEVGTSNGADQTFRTTGVPTLATEPATSVEATFATLHGTVTPNETPTAYYFEYGTTTSYGSKAPSSAKDIDLGFSEVDVSETLTGLAEGTIYHYRVVVESEVGSSTGADQTLTTASLSGPTYRFTFGSGEDGHHFDFPVYGITFTPDGHLLVSGSGTVQEFNFEGEYLSGFGSYGSGEGQFGEAMGITPDSKGDLWITDYENSRIDEFNPGGKYLGSLGSFGSDQGELTYPEGSIAVDSTGNIWVADSGNDRIEEFNSEGGYLTQFGTSGSGDGQLKWPHGIAIDSTGNIWVADSGNNRIEEFNSEGDYLTQVGTPGSGESELSWPTGIAIDSAGHLWITAAGNGRIEEFSATGKYLTQFGSFGYEEDQFVEPWSIAFDEENNAWIVDAGNWSVEKWTLPSGSARSVAATGSATAITGSTATLHGEVNPEGLATSYYFEYGKTTSYGSKAPTSAKAAGSGTNQVEVSQALSGLEPATTYHYRVVASNGEGGNPIKGADGTFKTTSAPVATTGSATAITSSTATLHGEVNPEGLATSYYFEYGKTTSYGSKAPTSAKAAGSGTNQVELSQALNGLESGTTYHLRIVATNGEGTAYGSDGTLKTSPAATETSLAVTQVLNGQPGYVTVSGSVKAGSYPLAGQKVKVKYEKENSSGGWTLMNSIEQELNASGDYSYENLAVSHANWRAVALFEGGITLAGSSSSYRSFHVGLGYQLVFHHSNKCIDVQNGGLGNGVQLQQWDCLDAGTHLNQVFQLVPVSGPWYQIRNINSARCIDVTGASTGNGGLLQQWDCAAVGWQMFQLVQVGGGWVSLQVAHTGKCIDVNSSSTTNGVILQQWDCHWGTNQQVAFSPVG